MGDTEGQEEVQERPETEEVRPEIIRERFYNLKSHPETAYRGNTERLVSGLGAEKLKAKEWLKDQRGYTLQQPAPSGTGNYRRRKIVASDVDHIWQADLADFQDYARENNGYRYLLTVIDVFSRYGMGEPLVRKAGPDVKRALETVFNRVGRMPIKLQTDLGKEFYNQHVKGLLQRHGIEHYSTDDNEIKAAIVERFNRTLKDTISRLLVAQGTVNWTANIQPVIQGYNQSYHRTLRTSPLAVMQMSGSERSKLWDRQYPHVCDNPEHMYQNVKDDLHLNVGDYVLLQVEKKRFEHGFTPRWTREVFRIWKKCFSAGRIYFKLQDLKGEEVDGSWLSEQLNKVNGPDGMQRVVERVVDRRPGEVKVKYLGWPDKHNRWVSNHTLQPITSD